MFDPNKKIGELKKINDELEINLDLEENLSTFLSKMEEKLNDEISYDADISKWILAGNNQSFVFPKNTVLGSKKKIMFSSKITHFSISDKNNLKLLNMQGELIFDYSSSILVPAVAVPVKVAKSKISVNQDSAIKPKPLEGIFLPETKMPGSNLSASVIQSDIVKDNPGNMYTTIISQYHFV